MVSAAATRWSWLENGLPEVEHRECRRLLVRAIIAGESEQIMDDALEEFRGQEKGEWEHVLAYYRRGPGPARRKRATSGDQGSRLQVKSSMDEEPSSDAEGWARLSLDADTRDLEELASENDPFAPSSQDENYEPPPRRTTTKEKPPVSSLPPDVASLDQWGATLIQFGKYKSNSMTYEELATKDTKEANSYKVWVVSHLNTTTGQCQDFGRFLKAFNEAGYSKPQAIIPGTTMPRQYGNTKTSKISSSYKTAQPTTPRR